MDVREHQAAVVEAVIRWQKACSAEADAGDGHEAEEATEALFAAVQELRRSRGDYQLADGTGIGPAEDELRSLCEAQLEAHGVEATPASIAACRTVAAGWVMLAQESRELLGALVIELEQAYGNALSLDLRELVTAAHAVLTDEEEPPPSWVCSRCSCTDEHACEGGCYWITSTLCSACLTGEERAIVAEVLRASTATDLARAEERWAATRVAGTDLAALVAHQEAAQLERFAERVRAGEDPDAAARAIGATGRP